MNKLVTTMLLAGLIGMLPLAQAAEPAKVSGGMLTGSDGMTLYTFDKDVAGDGKSACTGPCAEKWPPLDAPAGAKPTGDFTIVTRDDGTHQWAYKGKPLYFWSNDKAPGDKTGDGVKQVWHVAKP